ncbi:hypothetical protein GEMRC1_007296 [Eukaryota sp. GEM-RC1]
MKIQFAKSKSDVVAKAEGTFDPTVLPQRAEQRKVKIETRLQQQPSIGKRTSSSLPEEAKPKPKQVRESTEVVGPNKVLFIKGLPHSMSQEALKAIFDKFTGFQSVTLVPGRAGFAFVEFSNESEAALCLQDVNGISVQGSAIEVSFAKK